MRRLSARLEALMSLCRKGERGADVGCDHGYVSIRLVRDGVFSSMLAMDLRNGPLEAAREHIRAEGLADRIECRISDGMAALKPGEADALICAGMGGELMQRILREGMDRLLSMEQLILQPQSEVPAFRAFLRQAGFRIAEEKLILEDGKFYPMFRAVHGKEEYTEEEAGLFDAYGRQLLSGKDPTLKLYLEKEQRTITEVREKLLAGPGRDEERIRMRLAEVETDLGRNERALTLLDNS